MTAANALRQPVLNCLIRVLDLLQRITLVAFLTTRRLATFAATALGFWLPISVTRRRLTTVTAVRRYLAFQLFQSGAQLGNLIKQLHNELILLLRA